MELGRTFFGKNYLSPDFFHLYQLQTCTMACLIYIMVVYVTEIWSFEKKVRIIWAEY